MISQEKTPTERAMTAWPHRRSKTPFAGGDISVKKKIKIGVMNITRVSF